MELKRLQLPQGENCAPGLAVAGRVGRMNARADAGEAAAALRRVTTAIAEGSIEATASELAGIEGAVSALEAVAARRRRRPTTGPVPEDDDE